MHVATQLASGEHTDFATLPYFFGTMADLAFLEYVGIGTGTAVVRGDLEGDDMSIAYLEAGVLVGLLHVGRGDDLAAARELIPLRATLDPELLRVAARPLAECRTDSLVTS